MAPNVIFIYRDINKFFTATGSAEEAYKFYKLAVSKYPNHSPFIYSAAEWAIKLADAIKVSDPDRKGALLLDALDQLRRLEEMEPENPDIYNLKGMAHFAQNNFNETIADVVKEIDMHKKRGEKAPLRIYANLLSSSLLARNKEMALKAIDEASSVYSDSAAVFLSGDMLNNFTWSFSTNDSDNIIDDDVAAPKAKEYEGIFAIYEKAEELCEKHGMPEEAARSRKNSAEIQAEIYLES